MGSLHLSGLRGISSVLGLRNLRHHGLYSASQARQISSYCAPSHLSPAFFFCIDPIVHLTFTYDFNVELILYSVLLFSPIGILAFMFQSCLVPVSYFVLVLVLGISWMAGVGQSWIQLDSPRCSTLVAREVIQLAINLFLNVFFFLFRFICCILHRCLGSLILA